MTKTIAKHAGRISQLRDWITRQPKWVIIGVAFGLCCIAGTFTALVAEAPYRLADASVVDSIARQYALHDTTVFTDPKMHPESIYLSAYPNNRSLAYVLMLLYKAVSVVSTSESAFVSAATVVNIVLGSIAVVVISITIYELTHRKLFGLIAYVVAAFLIVLNPNLTIFYSDVPALLITATTLLLLVRISQTKAAPYPQLIALAVLLALGAFIKPPSVILILAFIVVAAFFAIKKRPIVALNVRKISAFLGALAITVVVSNGVVAITPNFGKFSPQMADQYRVNALSYFGMGSLRGLDPYPTCNTGSYCQPYISDTIGVWGGQKPEFASQKARDTYALSLIKQSVTEDFPTGYLSFVAQKLAHAFFPARAYYTENTDITSNGLMWLHHNKTALNLRHRVYGDRGLYPTSVRLLSFVAAAVVLVGFIRLFVRPRKGAWLPATLYLSLFLFAVYGTLSEFRAAYVWQFLPILIALSAIACRSVIVEP